MTKDDLGLGSVMDKLTAAVTRQLSEKVAASGKTTANCVECHKETPISNLRPKALIRGVSLKDEDIVEVGLCCKECCKKL